jgi:putative flippase GtrA
MNETASQAARYLIGAVIALVLDALTMLLLVKLGAPIVVARVIALVVGITTTYVFNRAFTFEVTHRTSFGDWGKYAIAQSVGSALNFGVSTLSIHFLGRETWAIAASVCLGAAIGFCYNFFAARKLLHRAGDQRE